MRSSQAVGQKLAKILSIKSVYIWYIIMFFPVLKQGSGHTGSLDFVLLNKVKTCTELHWSV